MFGSQVFEAEDDGALTPVERYAIALAWNAIDDALDDDSDDDGVFSDDCEGHERAIILAAAIAQLIREDPVAVLQMVGGARLTGSEDDPS